MTALTASKGNFNGKKVKIIFSLVVTLFVLIVVILPDYWGSEIYEIQQEFPGIDKLAHFCEHVAIFLALFFFWGCTKWGGKSVKVRIFLALACSFLFSFVDETRQLFIAGRNFELADILANTIGTVTGIFIVLKKEIQFVVWGQIMLVLFFSVGLIAFDTHAKLKPFYKGMEYEKAFQYGKAKVQYFKAIEAGNRSAELYNTLAWLELEFIGNDPQFAYEYAQKAVHENPHNPDILDTYGWSLYNIGRNKEALIFLKKAASMKPGMYCIHLHLGSTYLALGEVKKAIFHFKEQLKRNPDDRFGLKAGEGLKNIKKKNLSENYF